MNSAPSTTHRTVALVGAAGSGKTTLAEALLLRAGAIPRAGTVEQGNTVCDHDPEEIARGMSRTPASHRSSPVFTTTSTTASLPPLASGHRRRTSSRTPRT